MKRTLKWVSFLALGTLLLAAPNVAQQAQRAAPDQERPGLYALMSFIPAGDFLMGREDNKYDLLNKFPRDKDDDRPIHKVYVDGFYMDKFEVTNLEYYRFVEATRRPKPWHWKNGEFPPDMRDKAVYNVTWHDAVAYCKWVGKRLPTEAEFEKASRGGLELMYYVHGGKAIFSSGRRGGDDDDDDAGNVLSGDEEENQKKVDNAFAKFADSPFVDKDIYRSSEKIENPSAYAVTGGIAPNRVGTKKPNNFGLYDVMGNVAEWTSDWFGLIYYEESPYKNPLGPENGIHRVIRGGSWNDNGIELAVFFRDHAPAETKAPTIGFRCACDAPAALKSKSTQP
jgi:iron(II)-dependent oxidoreductase